VPTRLAALLVAAVAALAALAPQAHAAFAGRNGSIAYDGRWSASGLVSLRRPDGSRLRQIRTTGAPVDPAFSPLGKRIAYSTDGQIWVMEADGTLQRQVTQTFTSSTGPAWSPAGDALVFVSGLPGDEHIWRIGADGNKLRRLTGGARPDSHPSWSVNNGIVFVRRNVRGDGDLRRIRSSGGGSTLLTRGPKDDEFPSWSPDGRQVAFTRGSPAARDLYVIDRDGTHLRRLTRLDQPVSSPAWSPDGRWIAFTAGPNGSGALYKVRATGGRVRRISPTTAAATDVDWQPTGAPPVIAAAGDIACDAQDAHYDGGLGSWHHCHQLATSNLLLKMDLSKVLALGDVQYTHANDADAFPTPFDQTWGRVKELIRPVVGNHDWHEGAPAYFDYFDGPGVADGIAGPRGEGWYSFNLGSWHLVALNSNCGGKGALDCSAGSPEERWLQADLAAHPRQCTLAFFHHPLSSSGIAKLNTTIQPLWNDLMAAHVDLVLAGHDHAYERFAPLDANGNPDPVNGVREFVVGTGGRDFNVQDHHKPGSEVRENTAFGVLRLTLGQGAYRWRFMPEAHHTFTDSGEAACH
jgi:Tol biopolymer transport system component